jgi:hypothetical protein
MTTTEHTKGPWNICLESAHRPELVTAHPNKNICSVWSGGSVSQIKPEEWRANARLIAAASELLDALEDLVGRERAEAAESGFTDDEMSWLEDARRIIAKAKGGAS